MLDTFCKECKATCGLKTFRLSPSERTTDRVTFKVWPISSKMSLYLFCPEIIQNCWFMWKKCWVTFEFGGKRCVTKWLPDWPTPLVNVKYKLLSTVLWNLHTQVFKRLIKTNSAKKSEIRFESGGLKCLTNWPSDCSTPLANLQCDVRLHLSGICRQKCLKD